MGARTFISITPYHVVWPKIGLCITCEGLLDWAKVVGKMIRDALFGDP